jgi:hypothetical protein
MEDRTHRLAAIWRAVAGVVFGLCFGFAFGFLTVNAAWSERTMLASQGLMVVVALGFAIRRTRLHGFGFIEGVFSGIAVSIVLFLALLLWVVIGA